MRLYRAFLWTWLPGLAVFVVVLALHAPLILTQVPGGIVDHQAAATAAEVDRIQIAWRGAGLRAHASFAMIADLIFISLYGIGSILGGLHFRRADAGFLRRLGTMITIAGAVFLAADFAETTAQLIQLLRFAGDDTLAGLAATVQPVKIAAWAATFIGMLLALVTDYRRARAA